MNRSARLLLMLGMIFGVLTAASAQEPVPAQNNPQNSGATISGRVTIGGKGSPSVVVVLAKVPTDMRKAIQQLLTDGLAGLRTTTDLDGSYTFTGVQAGHYQVSPFAPSCASKIGEGTELAVNDGDTVGGIDFALERGGVITGRVTASDGRPLIGMEVSAFPDPGSANGEQAASLQSLTMRPHTTDDRGVYRLYGLPAGRYQVHVVQPTPARTDPDSHATYYPGVEDPASAGKVDITAGSEAAGIDIKVTIRSSATYRLSGRVVDESGNPVAGVQVTYGSTAEGRAGAAGGEPVQTNSVGEFHMQGLHNGSYQATVFNGIGGESTGYSDPAPFEIKDSDASGVEVHTHPGGTVTGTVLLDGVTDPDAAALLTQQQISGVFSSSLGGVGFNRSPIAPDGSFLLHGLPPGQVRFTLGPLWDFSSSNPFRVARVEHDGAPVQGGLQLDPNQHVTGIRVVVAYANCSISGTVTLRGAKLPPGSGLIVVAMPKNSSDGGEGTGSDMEAGSRLFGGEDMVQPDPSGQFQLTGLTPGSYSVTVQVQGPSVSGAHASKTVSVTSGGHALVDLELDLSSADTSQSKQN